MTASGNVDRNDVIALRERTHNDAENKGDAAEAAFRQNVADNAEYHEYPHVKYELACSKAAHKAGREYRGDEIFVFGHGDLDCELCIDKAEYPLQKACDDHREEQRVYMIGILPHYLRAGTHSVHDQRREHDGGGRTAGDAERHRGDERAARHRVVCRLRGDYAVGRALAELIGILREKLCLGIGHEGRHIYARSRQDADKKTDEGGQPENEL